MTSEFRWRFWMIMAASLQLLRSLVTRAVSVLTKAGVETLHKCSRCAGWSGYTASTDGLPACQIVMTTVTEASRLPICRLVPL